MEKHIIPPVNSTGKPIIFYSDDYESTERIKNVFKSLSSVLKRVDTLEHKVSQVSYEKDTTNANVRNNTELLTLNNDRLTKRVASLEYIYKELLKSYLLSIPRQILFRDEESNEPPLILDDVRDHWLHKAAIQLREGEKVEKRVVYPRNG